MLFRSSSQHLGFVLRSRRLQQGPRSSSLLLAERIHTTMRSKSNTDPSVQNLALETSDLVLTVVRDAARLAPIPYLQDAAGLALGIVNIIQVSLV